MLYHEQFFLGTVLVWRAMHQNKPLFGSDHPKGLHFKQLVFNREHAQQLIDDWGCTISIDLEEDWRYSIFDASGSRVDWMYYRPYKALEKRIPQPFPLEILAGPEGGNLFKYIEEAESCLWKLKTHFEQMRCHFTASTKEVRGVLANTLDEKCLTPEAQMILKRGLPEKPRRKNVATLADFLKERRESP